ncbi:MAG: HTH-type transcriptional regulator CysB [Vibrio sp.]
MKLQQLEAIVAVANHELNVTAAAQHLDIFQSNLSKHIASLEEELGVKIFTRDGRKLSALTEPGQNIIEIARNILTNVNGIESVAKAYTHPSQGHLRLSTTHTQARYVLPPTIKAFKQKYPDVSLQIHQGTPQQMADSLHKREADFVIVTEALDLFQQAILLPCYHWNRSIIVLKDHPLAQLKRVELSDLARFDLVSYVFAFAEKSDLSNAFHQAGLSPKVVFSATDTDVIKTYVRIGLGVGLIASLAIDPSVDDDFVVIDASHLFHSSQTCIAFNPGLYLRDYMYDFIESFSPHLTQAVVNHALKLKNQKQRDDYFSSLRL